LERGAEEMELLGMVGEMGVVESSDAESADVVAGWNVIL